MHKPKKRTFLHLFLGSIFFTLKKQIYWNFLNIPFAKINHILLTITVATFSSPLRRHLSPVDTHLQENKIHNLSLAIKNINHITLKPGEVFSYWKAIGNPNAKKGYKNGMILKNGKALSGIGGGLCQLSNLIYWTTLHTPLTVIERHRHGYDIFADHNRKRPFGSGATCSYPNIDLQIKNTTNQDFQIVLQLTKNHLYCSWSSLQPFDFTYKIFESDHQILSHTWGYTRNNKIFKEITNKTTNKSKTELVTTNSALMMYSPLLPKL